MKIKVLFIAIVAILALVNSFAVAQDNANVAALDGQPLIVVQHGHIFNVYRSTSETMSLLGGSSYSQVFIDVEVKQSVPGKQKKLVRLFCDEHEAECLALRVGDNISVRGHAQGMTTGFADQPSRFVVDQVGLIK